MAGELPPSPARQASDRNTTFNAKADATAWLSGEEAALRSGRPAVDPRRARDRFEPFATEWLEERPLRDRTREVYASILRVDVLPEFGDLQLNGITPDRVGKWHHGLARSKPSMAPKAYRLLRTILSTAVDDGVLGENPCRLRGAASEKARERRIPTMAEVELVADTIEARFRAAVLLAAYAGLRKGECFGLARRHVNLDRERPSVRIERTRGEVSGKGLVFSEPKTDAGTRTVALPARLCSELGEHLDRFVGADPDSRLFAQIQSRPGTPHLMPQ